MRQAARLRGEGAGRDGAAVRAASAELRARMTAEQARAGRLQGAVAHFRKVTASYGDGLFHCYDVPDLPRTNNDLERRCGTLR